MINKYQNGGQAQDVQQQIVQLVQSAMQGDQLAQQQIQQIMQAAQQGDQKAVQIAQMIQEVVKKMKGAQTARNGMKFRYRAMQNSISGCPAGTTPIYFKRGGSVGCNCVSNDKVVENKCGGKTKKKYFQDGGRTDTYMMESNKCGGKVKKKQTGGEVDKNTTASDSINVKTNISKDVYQRLPDRVKVDFDLAEQSGEPTVKVSRKDWDNANKQPAKQPTKQPTKHQHGGLLQSLRNAYAQMYN